MQKGHLLEFRCTTCEGVIQFSLFNMERLNHLITCSSCAKGYSFTDETLKRQLRKFVALCQQIAESDEILSHTSVGVNVGNQCVKIPYKLLLTRLSSSIELNISGHPPLEIAFRLEPLSDCPKNLSSATCL